jgi:hypothetical protein
MTVDCPVYIDATYQQGKYGEEGVARHGYAVDGLRRTHLARRCERPLEPVGEYSDRCRGR